MSQRAITNAATLKERVFHTDGTGLRGITLLQASAPRGVCLSVRVLDDEGKRKAITTVPLDGRDFFVQWRYAVDKIATYYNILLSDPLYAEMLAASSAFMRRYNLKTKPVTYMEAELVE